MRAPNHEKDRDWESGIEGRERVAALLGVRHENPAPIRHLDQHDIAGGECRRCGRRFYRISKANCFYCCDKCVNAVRVAAVSKAGSESRAAARADRRCEVLANR